MNPSKTDSKTFTGEVGTTVTVEIPSMSGFTYNAAKSTVSGKLTENGTLVLKIYYDRDEQETEEEEVRYTITYVLNGGTNSQKNVSEYTAGSRIRLFVPTYDKKHVFAGWFTTENFESSSVIKEIVPSNKEDLTIYAKWNERTDSEIANPVYYKITYNIYDGMIQTGSYEAGVPKDFLEAERPGYTFEGWYTSEDFKDESRVYYIDAEMTGDYVLYAKWSGGESDTSQDETVSTPTTYTIHYELNGGTNAQNPTSYTAGQGTGLSNPSKTGYVFDGWYQDASCSGTKVEAISANTTGNITLYAKWIQTVINLKQATVKLQPGKTVNNVSGIQGSAGTVTYASSNSKVAQVSADGVVKGISAGQASITVSVNGVSTSFVVKVAPKKVTGLKVKKKSSTSAKITWKKVSGASGYEVSVKQGANGKYKVAKTLKGQKKVTYTKTKLKRGKTYYIRIRAYKTIGGEKVYGDYTSAKKYKVK